MFRWSDSVVQCAQVVMVHTPASSVLAVSSRLPETPTTCSCDVVAGPLLQAHRPTPSASPKEATDSGSEAARCAPEGETATTPGENKVVISARPLASESSNPIRKFLQVGPGSLASHGTRHCQPMTPRSLFALLLLLWLASASASGVVNEPLGPSPLSSKDRELRTSASEAGALLQPSQPHRTGHRTLPVRDTNIELLGVFALLRGGLPTNSYSTFELSCQCLRAAMPSGVPYDHIVLHESSVASDVQLRLSSTL